MDCWWPSSIGDVRDYLRLRHNVLDRDGVGGKSCFIGRRDIVPHLLYSDTELLYGVVHKYYAVMHAKTRSPPCECKLSLEPTALPPPLFSRARSKKSLEKNISKLSKRVVVMSSLTIPFKSGDESLAFVRWYDAT